MKKIIMCAMATCFLIACNGEGDRTGNVDDTAMTAPPSGQPDNTGQQNAGQQPGAGQQNQGQRTDSTGRGSMTDTSHRIGDSVRD